MKVSVVTISYNQAEFLGRCIESCLAQDYDQVEYIVVDPGSTDGSRDIIRDYAGRISKILLEPDTGPAHGLNNGFSHATGDLYYYLNADDQVRPGTFRRVVDEFTRRPDLDVIIGNGLMIDRYDRPCRKIYSSRKWTLRGYAYGVSSAVQQATFFRREAYNSAGGFNPGNGSCWDGELLVDMAAAGARVGYIDRVLGCFRMYSGSISGSGRLLEQYARDQARIREKILAGSTRSAESSLFRGYHRCIDMLVQPEKYAYNALYRLRTHF